MLAVGWGLSSSPSGPPTDLSVFRAQQSAFPEVSNAGAQGHAFHDQPWKLPTATSITCSWWDRPTLIPHGRGLHKSLTSRRCGSRKADLEVDTVTVSLLSCKPPGSPTRDSFLFALTCPCQGGWGRSLPAGAPQCLLHGVMNVTSDPPLPFPLMYALASGALVIVSHYPVPEHGFNYVTLWFAFMTSILLCARKLDIYCSL